MLKIRITASGEVFEFEGDAPFTELAPLIVQWFYSLDLEPVTQEEIDAMTLRVKTANDKLHDATTRNTPPVNP